MLPHSPILLSILLVLFSCAPEPDTTTAEASDTQTFTSHDGKKIAYRDTGTGPAVLLLHGFINDGSSWLQTELYRQLVANGYRVISPDMRGSGQSARPHTDEAYANDAEVKDLIKLADELKLQSYVAVGYSRGAVVLAKLLTKDDRVTRAVLGGMGVDFTDPEWPRRKQFAAAFNGELTSGTTGAVEYAKSIGADLKALHLLQKHQPVTSPDELRNVSIPILVAMGSGDKDNGDPGRLERLFPNGQLAMMPGDHDDTLYSPVFAAAVMAFVKAGTRESI